MNLRSAVRLLRPTQWVKNLFLVAPLIFSRHLFDGRYAWRVMLALVIFSVVSSVVYIVNDIADRDADRLHPVERLRPIAAGELPAWQALLVAVVLLAVAGSFWTWLDARFWSTVILYLGLNIAYSVWLKRVILVDVFIIAAGFMLRVLAGVFAIDVSISPWLVLCTLFVSVFLAVSKRRAELLLNDGATSAGSRPVLREYDREVVDQMMTVAASGMAISYALYTVADRTVKIFGTENLIFTTVFVLFGIFRYLFLIRQKKTDDNPMHVLISDVPLMLNILAWFAACVAIIYAEEIHHWLR